MALKVLESGNINDKYMGIFVAAASVGICEKAIL